MKNLFVVVWFIPAMALGQSYSVEYSFTGSLFSNDSGPGSFYYIELHDSSTGEFAVLYQAAFGDNIPGNPVQNQNVGFRPTQLRIRTNEVVNNTEDIVYIPADGHCFNDVVSIMDQNGQVKNVSLNIQPDLTISMNPNPNLENPPPGTKLYPSSCETLTLSSPANYADNVYRWEYSLDSGTSWTPLTDFDGINTFEIGIADIPGLAINDVIIFRMRFCDGQTSNLRTTHFSKCSPDITNFVTQAATCSYNHDGGFTVTFSRALDPAETLLLNLAQNAPAGDPGSILVAAPILTPGDLNAANSYTWADPLPPGTYYLRYQVDNDGSIYNQGPFNITTPPPVTFSAAWSNVNCFGGADGSISINAAGGVGNYQYELNGSGVWVNFTDATNHTIEGLLPGDYQLRVRDAGGCTEKTG